MSTSVLFVHNRYQERGGEDSVFEAESALLEARGHRVERLLFDNRDLSGAASPAGSLRLAVETIWSGTARRRLWQSSSNPTLFTFTIRSQRFRRRLMVRRRMQAPLSCRRCITFVWAVPAG